MQTVITVHRRVGLKTLRDKNNDSYYSSLRDAAKAYLGIILCFPKKDTFPTSVMNSVTGVSISYGK